MVLYREKARQTLIDLQLEKIMTVNAITFFRDDLGRPNARFLSHYGARTVPLTSEWTAVGRGFAKEVV